MYWTKIERLDNKPIEYRLYQGKPDDDIVRLVARIYVEKNAHRLVVFNQHRYNPPCQTLEEYKAYAIALVNMENNHAMGKNIRT
jgi:hypothetical protein